MQVGEHSGDLARLPEAGIVDLAVELSDFAETAAAIDNLDLVLSVDTRSCTLPARSAARAG